MRQIWIGRLRPSTESDLMPFAVIACDVFSAEIEHFLTATDVPLFLLEMGLHDQPDNLRQKLQAKIDAVAAMPGITSIRLAYGRCGNGLDGITAPAGCELILPQAHDCVSILLGSTAKHEALLKAEPGTYFYSPGWVRENRVPGPDREQAVRALYAARFADDPEMIDELVEADASAFAHHTCAAYISIIQHPESDQYCRQCARHMNWRHCVLEGDASLLRALLADQPLDARLVRIASGNTIRVDANGHLMEQNEPHD